MIINKHAGELQSGNIHHRLALFFTGNDIVSCVYIVLLFQHLDNKTAPGSIDLTVNILTMGYWPSYPVCDVNMPEEVRISAVGVGVSLLHM